jgi:enoyl-CoA hydratase/carnithine racemase
MFLLERNDDYARLILDRPDVRNAIPAAGWAALSEKLAVVAASDVRMLVVAGAGDTFCAGADLGDFAAMRGDGQAAASFREEMRAALDALRALAIPTLALIEGSCFGAGVALALACDVRMARLGAKLAITPAKIGIAFPQEDVHRLVTLVGPGQAARLLFTAETIGGDEARRIGLVDYYCHPESEVIAAILANDRESLRMLKQQIALAGADVGSDPDMDRRFDAMIAGEEMARRLEARRRK